MFYGTDDGNRLVDEKNYPESIKIYLNEEKNRLNQEIKKYDIIIEVGCMEARNMDIAVNNKKKYIGIDIVEEYIDAANRIIDKRNLNNICEFLCINAERLDEVLQKSKLIKNNSRILFFFPFNSFGNMENYISVIDSIVKIKNADFIIFSYNTDTKTTAERYNYYNNCKYDNLSLQKEKDGIRFIADNGLNSMAYNQDYLDKLIRSKGLSLSTTKFADIGIAYSISTREREMEI